MDAEQARALLVKRMARLGRGDRSALADIYRLTAAKLFGVCLRILDDRGEAEEVLQEVYVTIWHKAGTFDASRSSPITWMVAIARNRAIDRVRASNPIRRSEPLELAVELPDPRLSADVQIERDDDKRRLHGCLDELDPEHATAIRTAFIHGATYEELAERMNVPLGTMKSWIRRSLLKLRACLDQ